MLGGELGRGRDLHPLGLLERALGEGREPGQALDLDVEQLAADRALLGGGVDVEDVATNGELAAVLHLLDALVAAGHQLPGHLVEVDQAALLDREAVRAQLGVGQLLGQRHSARDQHGGLVTQQGIERCNPQADEMRRRREVRLVAHPAGGIEADGPRAQEGPEVGGQVARRAVVTGHHQRGPPGSASISDASRYGRRLDDTNARWGSSRAASARAATDSSCCAYLRRLLSMRCGRPATRAAYRVRF